MTASINKSIAVVGGTGALGWGIASRLARAGYLVIIGSRTEEKATEAANRIEGATGVPPKGATNSVAAATGDVIFVTVPWSSQSSILEEIKPHVAGKLVVDTTVPLVPPRVARVQMPPQGCAALAAQERLGGVARVVSAFHNVAAHKLATSEAIECDVLVFGDETSDREVVISMIASMGLRGIHGGPLGNSVAAEALTSVLIGINKKYSSDGAGVRISNISP